MSATPLTSMKNSLETYDLLLRCPYSNEYLTEAVHLSCGHIVTAEIALKEFGPMINNRVTKPKQCIRCPNIPSPVIVISYQTAKQHSQLVTYVLGLKGLLNTSPTTEELNNNIDNDEHKESIPTIVTSPVSRSTTPTGSPKSGVSDTQEEADSHIAYMNSLRDGFDPEVTRDEKLRKKKQAEAAKKAINQSGTNPDDDDLMFHLELNH